jgi:hypothetical protein
VHGLCLVSDITIDGAPTAHAGELGRRESVVDEALAREETAGHRLVWGAERHIPSQRPEGRRIAEAAFAGRLFYTISETAAGFLLRFPGTCDAAVSPDLRLVTVHPSPTRDRSLIPVLLGGNVIAFLLAMSGQCVLHASAIEVDGTAIAFAGSTGSGKSTIAVLLCSAGADLVSDDLLRVENGRCGARCFRGGWEARLRCSAQPLARSLAHALVRSTADGRLAVRLPQGSDRPVLGAVVLPRLSRSAAAVQMNRLPPADALIELTRIPRTHGWSHPDVIEAQFRHLARLVRTTPVYQAQIPRGALLEPAFGTELLRSCRLVEWNTPERV